MVDVLYGSAENLEKPRTTMTSFPRYAVVSVLSIAGGFFACRTFHESDGAKVTPLPSASTFESEALGFVNWYRIQGRDAIPHQELIRNLQILESKAIASGQLISTHSTNSNAEQDAPSNR